MSTQRPKDSRKQRHKLWEILILTENEMAWKVWGFSVCVVVVIQRGLIVIEKLLLSARLLGSRDLRPPLGHSRTYMKVCVPWLAECVSNEICDLEQTKGPARWCPYAASTFFSLTHTLFAHREHPRVFRWFYFRVVWPCAFLTHDIWTDCYVCVWDKQ